MTIKTVNTAGGGGGYDYSSWASWIAACPSNLTSHGSPWIGEGSGTFNSGPGTISGITTDSTNKVIMRTASGASWRDNGSVQTNDFKFNTSNGCAITTSTPYSTTILCSVQHMDVIGFQITATMAYGIRPCIQCNAGGSSEFKIEWCILETTAAAVIDLYGGNNYVSNSLVVNRGSGRPEIAKMASSSKSYNTTFVVPTDKTAATNGITGLYGGSVHENSTFLNITNLWGSGGTPTFTTCQTSVAGNPNSTTSVTYNTSLLANITDSTRNFKPVTGSAMLDVGTTDATYSSVDAAGTSRPQGSAYDIGAWELVVASGTNYPLTADPGSLTFSGGTATMEVGRILTADPGALTFTGGTATLNIGKALTANPGSLAFTAQVATFVLGRVLVATPGALTFTGAAATLTYTPSGGGGGNTVEFLMRDVYFSDRNYVYRIRTELTPLGGAQYTVNLTEGATQDRADGAHREWYKIT